MSQTLLSSLYDGLGFSSLKYHSMTTRNEEQVRRVVCWNHQVLKQSKMKESKFLFYIITISFNLVKLWILKLNLINSFTPEISFVILLTALTVCHTILVI